MCACSVASVVSDSLRPHGCSLPGSSVCGILQTRKSEGLELLSSYYLLYCYVAGVSVGRELGPVGTNVNLVWAGGQGVRAV